MMLTEENVLSVIRKRDGEKYYVAINFRKASLKLEDNVYFSLFPDKSNRTDYAVSLNELYTDYVVEPKVYLAIINALINRVNDLSMGNTD